MAIRSYRDPWVKKAKWLTQALIISGTLNVGLLSTFIYFAMKEDKNSVSLSQSPQIKADSKHHLGIQQLLSEYTNLSFQDLLLRLGNTDHVESGLTRRDLALACLVRFHYFNLERALGGLTLQKRDITFQTTDNNGETSLTVFPGLADYQYQAIVQYAKTETWPLTAEGLFSQLKLGKPPHDQSLLEAFYLSPEFHFINLLFTKTGITLKKEYIATLLSQSDWPTISEVATHLRNHGDFSVAERRHFLLQLVDNRSRLAAKILLETDQEHLLLNLENQQIINICDLLGDRTTPSFLRALLDSPRSDEVWKKAAAILYEQAAENLPETLNLDQAKRRFLELKVDTPLATQKVSTGKKSYTVQSGDSLWKIANQQKTTVKALRETNNLKSDNLKPGQTLTIP